MKTWLITKNILKGILALVIVLAVIYFLLAIYATVTSNFGVPKPLIHSYLVDGNQTYSYAVGWRADSGRGRSEIYLGYVENENFEGLIRRFCFGLRSVSEINPRFQNCAGMYLESDTDA